MREENFYEMKEREESSSIFVVGERIYRERDMGWVDAKDTFYMIADEGFSESFNKCWQNIQMNFSFSKTVFCYNMLILHLLKNPSL